VSAIHDIGVSELLEDVTKVLPEAKAEEKKSAQIKVAIVGRPNVGKSSFINRLFEEERVIVDEVPGTTRDTVDTYFRDGDTEFVLIDTAGLRHKKKVKEAVDVYSIMRTKEAVLRSDACLVLIDGFDGLVADDLRILDLVFSAGKGCVLCVNKWDLMKNTAQPKYKEMVYERAPFLKRYPVLFTSTKTGYNVYGALKVLREVTANASIGTTAHGLNKLLNSLKTKGPFSPRRNNLKCSYIIQTGVRPPAFLLFVNDTKLISEEHHNFIENSLRKNFSFFGTPIRLTFRGQKRGKT
jgi:GTP-binding protein